MFKTLIYLNLISYNVIYRSILFESADYNSNTYDGAGSPSASHSIMKGLSLSLGLDFTWNSSSSVGGSLIIFGGLCTIKYNGL